MAASDLVNMGTWELGKLGKLWKWPAGEQRDSNVENSVEGTISGQRSKHIEFLASFDGDASTFPSYFVFYGAPRIDGRMVA